MKKWKTPKENHCHEAGATQEHQIKTKLLIIGRHSSNRIKNRDETKGNQSLDNSSNTELVLSSEFYFLKLDIHTCLLLSLRVSPVNLTPNHTECITLAWYHLGPFPLKVVVCGISELPTCLG